MYTVSRNASVVYRNASLARVREWLEYARAEYPGETFTVAFDTGADSVHVDA